MSYKDQMKAKAAAVKPMPSRDMTQTHPYFQKKAAQLATNLKGRGIVIGWSNLLRSWIYQDQLFAQGRTKPGKRVTAAKGGQSAHNYGFAGDFYIIDYPGKPKGSKDIYPAGPMNIVIAEARKIGFTSGDDWGDDPHLQIVTNAELDKIEGGADPGPFLK